MSPKKSKSTFTNQKSNFTKIPSRPFILPVVKTPEEVAQEIEGLRMHMAYQLSQEESKNDLKEDFKASEGLFKYLNPDLIPENELLENGSENPTEPFLKQQTPEDLEQRITNQIIKLLNLHHEECPDSFHLKEKNAWLDEKEILKSRISELESFNYSITNEKNKLYSENVGLQGENFTLSTTADELSEALEKNRYLEETLQKRNEFIKTLQDDQYKLGETIETLNYKLLKKDEFIKDLQDEKFEVEVDLEEVKESYSNLNEKHEAFCMVASEIKSELDEKNKELEHLKFTREIDDNVRLQYLKEIKDLKEQLEDGYSKYKVSQELLSSKADELFESQKKIESLYDLISKRNYIIKDLETALFDYHLTEINSFSYFIKNDLLPFLKKSGFLYFAIWLFAWILILSFIFGV